MKPEHGTAKVLTPRITARYAAQRAGVLVVPEQLAECDVRALVGQEDGGSLLTERTLAAALAVHADIVSGSSSAPRGRAALARVIVPLAGANSALWR